MVQPTDGSEVVENRLLSRMRAKSAAAAPARTYSPSISVTFDLEPCGDPGLGVAPPTGVKGMGDSGSSSSAVAAPAAAGTPRRLPTPPSIVSALTQYPGK